MNIAFEILLWLLLRSIKLAQDIFVSMYNHCLLIVMVQEIAIYLFLDLLVRWTVSKISLVFPSASSCIDNILAWLKIAPLNHFSRKHHPRLRMIEDNIREHLQNPQHNTQVINAYQQILGDIHQRRPNNFPTLTVVDIQHRFTQNWPRISPLRKALCLCLPPPAICYGMVERAINEPTIWINPYLVQALEAAQEVCSGKH